ncbi:hypothetical protein Tco_1448663 [Tanacetum coccineum]
MDDTRTMAQLLEAPTVGYEDAIVLPYQAPAYKSIGVSKEIQAYVKANDANFGMWNMQTQGGFKGVFHRSGVAYQGPTIHTTSSPKVVERETEVTKDTMLPTNNGSTEDVQPPVVPVVYHESISEPVKYAPVSASMHYPKSINSFPFKKRNDEDVAKKLTTKFEKIYDIFRRFEIRNCFYGCLDAYAKFACLDSNTLIGNKEKVE